MSALTEEQTNSVIEKLGQVYKLSDLFSKDAANRIVSRVKELAEWKTAIKQQLTIAGLPHSLDQIPQLLPSNPATNDSIVSLQSLTPLFSLYNLDVSKGSLTTLLDKISISKNLADAATKKLTEPGMPVNSGNNINELSLTDNDYILEEVKTLLPEYLAGTWFNRKRAFKINIELDWVNQVYGNLRIEPSGPMDVYLLGSTGERIWDFISEVYIHPTAIPEFSVLPRDGWIEVLNTSQFRYLADMSPLNFIERIAKSTQGRNIVHFKGGIGGWATFERVRTSQVTAAAERLLSKFSDPHYCARSDGKVVIKFKNMVRRHFYLDNSTFPSGRTLVSNENKFPF